MSTIQYQITDWSQVPETKHVGEHGFALWKTLQLDGVRIRVVDYSAGYLADHWCKLGHIVYCLEGELISELDDGTKSVLTPGMSYQVSDDLSNHRSYTATGAKLLIIDGDFLKK